MAHTPTDGSASVDVVYGTAYLEDAADQKLLSSVSQCDNAGLGPSQLSPRFSLPSRVLNSEDVSLPGASEAGSPHSYALSEGLPAQDSDGSKTFNLDIRDADKVTRYYEVAFNVLLSANCRVIASALIKHLEPNMRTSFPYKGPKRSKPGWWPHSLNYDAPGRLLTEGKLIPPLLVAGADFLRLYFSLNLSHPSPWHWP